MKKQFTKKSFAIFAVLLCSLPTIAGCSSNTARKNGTTGLQYVFDETTMTYGVSGYVGVDTEVYIPSKWQGYSVTSILENAFYNLGVLLDKIVVSSSVYRVEQHAFRGNIFKSNDFDKYINYVVFEAPNIYFECDAFYKCNIQQVQFKGDVLNYNGCLFNDCSYFMGAVMPKSFYNNHSGSANSPYLFAYLSVNFRAIFYLGSDSDDIYEYLDTSDSTLNHVSVYYYSEKKPSLNQSSYWHFVDGIPNIWGVTVVSR